MGIVFAGCAKMELHLSAPIRESYTSEVSETSEVCGDKGVEQDLPHFQFKFGHYLGTGVSRGYRTIIRSVQ